VETYKLAMVSSYSLVVVRLAASANTLEFGLFSRVVEKKKPLG